MKGSYLISARWSNDRSSPAEIGSRMLAMLDQLDMVGPRQPEWRFIDPSVHLPMPDDADYDEAIYEALADYEGAPIDGLRADPAHFVEQRIDRDDWNDPVPLGGYRISVWDQKANREDRSSQSMQLRITAGAKGYNSVFFEIGQIDGPMDQIVSYELYRKTLDCIVSNWPCPWAHAYFCGRDRTPLKPFRPEDLDSLMAEAFKPKPYPYLDWIGYLSAPLVRGLTAPSAMIAEPTPGGGLILSVTKDRLNPAHPDHRRGAAILTQVLDHCVEGRHAPSALPPAARIGPY